MAIDERIVAAAPDNPGYQRNLSVIYGRLADLAADVGQPAQAEQLHRQALAVYERLAAAAPDNPGYQRDLAVALRAAGRPGPRARPARPGRAAAPRQALAIRERLAAAAPDNPGYQQDLSVTYGKLADLAAEALPARPGRAAHRQALAIDERLAAAAPDNPGLPAGPVRRLRAAGRPGPRRRRSPPRPSSCTARPWPSASGSPPPPPTTPAASRTCLSPTASWPTWQPDAGEPAQAEQLHRQALAIDERLAAAAPDNPGYQRDLAVTYGKLADLAADAGAARPGRAAAPPGYGHR